MSLVNQSYHQILNKHFGLSFYGANNSLTGYAAYDIIGSHGYKRKVADVENIIFVDYRIINACIYCDNIQYTFPPSQPGKALIVGAGGKPFTIFAEVECSFKVFDVVKNDFILKNLDLGNDAKRPISLKFRLTESDFSINQFLSSTPFRVKIANNSEMLELIDKKIIASSHPRLSRNLFITPNMHESVLEITPDVDAIRKTFDKILPAISHTRDTNRSLKSLTWDVILGLIDQHKEVKNSNKDFFAKNKSTSYLEYLITAAKIEEADTSRRKDGICKINVHDMVQYFNHIRKTQGEIVYGFVSCEKDRSIDDNELTTLMTDVKCHPGIPLSHRVEDGSKILEIATIEQDAVLDLFFRFDVNKWNSHNAIVTLFCPPGIFTTDDKTYIPQIFNSILHSKIGYTTSIDTPDRLLKLKHDVLKIQKVSDCEFRLFVNFHNIAGFVELFPMLHGQYLYEQSFQTVHLPKDVVDRYTGDVDNDVLDRFLKLTSCITESCDTKA